MRSQRRGIARAHLLAVKQLRMLSDEQLKLVLGRKGFFFKWLKFPLLTSGVYALCHLFLLANRGVLLQPASG